MKIRYSPKHHNVLTIFIDDEPWRDIDTSIFGKKPPFPQFYASLDSWTLFFDEKEYQGALAYVTRCLSRRSYSSTELASKLRQRLVSEHTATRIINECLSRGYIDDQTWVKSFVRSQIARHNGPQMIKMKLRAKGIPQELIEATLSEMSDTESEEQILHLLKKRYGSRDLTDLYEKNKVINALMRKGFSFSLIQSILKASL